MFHQYHAQRFRSLYPAKRKKIGHRIVYERDPRDRYVGVIGVGAILLYTGRAPAASGLLPRDREARTVDRRSMAAARVRQMES